MVSFESKKILEHGNLGSILKNSRESKGEDIARISRVLKIQKKYIEALEKGHYWVLPQVVYAKNFLRTYAEYLELDIDAIEALFLKEMDIYKKTRGKTELGSPVSSLGAKSIKVKSFVLPRIFKLGLIILFLIACGIYIIFQMKSISTAPFLEITTPEDNYVTDKPYVLMEGRSSREATIFINGRLILLDESGNFTEEVPLQNGMNILKVSAIKRYSKENTILRKVMAVEEQTAIEDVNN